MFLTAYHKISHLGRADPKYDAMMCCPWWPCLPCGTAIMYSLMLVGIVLLSTVSLLAGILCCLPWSETQLNQEMKLHKRCCFGRLLAQCYHVRACFYSYLGFGVAALTIGKQISTKSSFTSPTGGSTAVYQNQKPMQSSCRCPRLKPKAKLKKVYVDYASTYRLGIDLFLPNFNGISSSTAGFRAIFFQAANYLS